MKVKICLMVAFAVTAFLIAVGVGSVPIAPGEALAILAHKLFARPLPDGMNPALLPIFWSIRLPRAIMAFLAGGALSVSGVALQSLLRNPLASSYTLGVSSGASLGAALVIVTGFSILGSFTLPTVGFLFGLGTILFVVALAARLDRSLSNQTVILVGMVLSLFTAAVLTLVSALSKDYIQQLIAWQMGSFSGKTFSQAGILLGIGLPAGLLIWSRGRELDLLTFGEEQALAAGVAVKREKRLLIILAALLTGVSVCFTGVIGFIDLVAPHMARRIFGPGHRLLIPMSALLGGAVLALCDLVARTVLAPTDLPVGAVTAILGAPFFAAVYFRREKRREEA